MYNRDESRRKAYNRKYLELISRCERCRTQIFMPMPEHCEDCTTGIRLRLLETQYSDITGWSHKNW